MEEASTVLTVYRTTKHDPPRREDFLSNRGLGLPQGSEESEEEWISISSFKTARKCKKRAARRNPDGYIVRFDLVNGQPITIGHVSKNGHVNLIGDPDDFVQLASTATIVRVSDVED